MSPSSESPIKTVDTSIEIIQALDDREGTTITELSQQLGKSKSTIHRHLSTLEQNRLVVKRDGDYCLGLRFLELGNSALRRYSFYPIAKPLVDELVQETQESCHFAVEEHGRAVYLYYARSEKGVRTDAHPGIPLYMHCTATGKALLAHLPRDRVDEILEEQGMPAKTEQTITDKAELYEELEEIRERGISFGDEERVDGMRGVAAPITERESGDILGALTVAGPTKRINGTRFTEELPNLLERTTQIIEVELSYGKDGSSLLHVAGREESEHDLS